MDLAVCRREDLPALRGRASLPIGHNAARRLDHRNRGLHVIGLQARLDHQINLPGGDQRIGVAIGAITHEFCPPRHPAKGGALFGGADLGEGGHHDGLGQTPGRARFQRGATQGAVHLGPAQAALKPLADIGLVDDAKDRPRRIAHRDQNAPCGRTAKITACAVDRVQDPCQAAGASLGAIFLAQDRILRAALGQDLAHPFFRQPIGHGHRVKPRGLFGFRRQAVFAKMQQCRHPRRIGQGMRRRHQIRRLGRADHPHCCPLKKQSPRCRASGTGADGQAADGP